MTDVEPLDDVVTRPLRRVEYEALIDQGHLVGEPIELVEGRLVTMTPQGDRHWQVVTALARLLIEAIPAEEGTVSVQGPLAADELSEPELDLYVAPPGATRTPGLPTSASLIIEVAVTSARYDLGVKAQLYARTGVPDYWVVDLDTARIVVHREPDVRGYRSIEGHAAGVVTALRHPGLRVDVADLLRVPG